jgi:DNA polymerase elongation subunit (family B)
LDFYTNVRQYGKNILYRGVENGKKVARRIEYRPTLFVPAKKKSKYKTLAGDYVEPIKPGTINDAREFLQRYEGVETFPIYGNNRYEYTYIADLHSDDVLWDQKYITIAYVDIEVSSANGFPEPDLATEEITAITVLIDGKYTTLGCGDYTPHRPDVTYIRCEDEANLLRKFLGFWSCNYPDIVTGWNIKFFDIPYLINRIVRILGEDEVKKISPWKKIRDPRLSGSLPQVFSNSFARVVHSFVYLVGRARRNEDRYCGLRQLTSPVPNQLSVVRRVQHPRHRTGLEDRNLRLEVE